MRVGIDFRFLAFGRRGFVRGIPRFSQEQLQSVLELDADNTYLLLCDAGQDVEAIRSEIREAPNVQLVPAPDGLQTIVIGADDPRPSLARFSQYQQWLEGLHLDLFHATCEGWLKGMLMPGFDVCPYVATAYDLIPLLYPAHYLPEPAERETYDQRLLFLQQATRIAAISHAVAEDVIEHLGVAAARIDVTPPAPSSCFRPLPPEVARGLLRLLDHPTRLPPRRRVQIPQEFLLCISDLHYSKNLTTLLSAYAELRRATRKRFPLVVAGHLSAGEEDRLHKLAEFVDIAGDVIVTGRIGDDELTALYNCATITVHPSHHEGFGLPVAEAMRCGSPVITTTRSALPETAGDAALLVDSDDAGAFTEAIEQLLADSNRRADLRRRGFMHAARFTSRGLGRATLQCYERTAGSATGDPAPNTARIALWSPIPPQDTAVASYTEDLITALAAEPDLDLDVFVGDGVRPPLSMLRAAHVRHWSDFERTARHRPFDVVIYEVGASPSHVYMERAMLSHPGVVVLHDLRWSRALLGDRLARDDGAQCFRRELDALEGERAAREWDRLRTLAWRGREQAELRFFDEHPMLGEVVDTARTLVALTPALADELRRRYPQADDLRVIPVGVADPKANGFGADRVAARAYLDLDRNAFTVLVPSTDCAAQDIDSALMAFAGLKRAGVDAVLAIVGSIPQGLSEGRLRATAASLGIGDAVRATGPVARVTFDAYHAACDAVMLLGDPGVGVIPEAAVRAFAVGRCVIIRDSPASRLIPDAACVRVSATPAETHEVTAALVSLADDGARRAMMERAARNHFAQSARLEPMVQEYVSLVREQAGRDRARPTSQASPTTIPAPTGRPALRKAPLTYSKVCELEDFAHPDLRSVIRDVCSHKREAFGDCFPIGYEYRKDWEVAMAVRTLADHGALRPDARLLGVAAGTEDTIFYLTRKVAEVVAIDRYLEPAEWEEVAPTAMLVDPARVAPFAFAPEHLTVQHMDARVLEFPDESFDGIFSSGSIEHFGDLQTIAAAAYEMGRVLKPGGILTLSTELLLSRDSSAAGVAYPGLRLLTPFEVQRYIVEASGLEAIDGLDLSVSHWTLATSRDMATAVRRRYERHMAQPKRARAPLWACWDMPHVVIELDGKRFTSVHMALRRASLHPVADNRWAQPTLELRADVRRNTMLVISGTGEGACEPPLNGSPSAAALRDELGRLTSKQNEAEEEIRALQRQAGAEAEAVSGCLQEAALPQPGVYVSWFPKPEPPSSPPDALPIVPAVGRVIPCPILSPIAPQYTVLVAADAEDIISGEYLAGRGAALNENLTSLVLALVPEGGTFLDVGANLGSISLPLAVSGRRVISVEAASVNAALLEASARVSGVSDRVRVLTMAVGDHDGEASFMPHGCHGQLVDGDVGGAVRVPLRTIDSVVASEELGRLDLVKVDVEGAEIQVLRGMRRLAQRMAPSYLLVECCPHTLAAFGSTAPELVSLLEEYGFTVYNIGVKRLMRRHPDEVQVTTVMDVLAAREDVHHLPGWRIEPPISADELVERFVYEAQMWSADCRSSAARMARELHPDVLEVPAVAGALNCLVNDPEPMVRAAVAWWREAHATLGARQ